jgi:hypothetical protein
MSTIGANITAYISYNLPETYLVPYSSSSPARFPRLSYAPGFAPNQPSTKRAHPITVALVESPAPELSGLDGLFAMEQVYNHKGRAIAKIIA